MAFGSFFNRLKVKNTFVDVGYAAADDADDIGYFKQQSEPELTTEKLLGSSFSRILDAQHSNLTLGSSSFLDAKHGNLNLGSSSFNRNPSFCQTASFCASVAEGTEETEWGPGEDSSGIAWSDMEAMVQQVTEEPGQDQGQNEVSAVPVMWASPISLAEAILVDTDPESSALDSNQAQMKAKTRRRRKRDSLIDKAAKSHLQNEVASNPAPSDSSVCPQCGGKCASTFKFCQFCGASLR